jgi:Ca-activated chloride channel homolog
MQAPPSLCRRRRYIHVAFIASAIFSGVLLFLLAVVSPSGYAQEQRPAPTAQPSPSPQATPTPPTTTTVPPRTDGGIGQDSTLFSNTDLVTLTVTVTDGQGRFVTGLNQSAFTVTDNGQPQEISFFSDEDAPVSIAVVFDVSGSMSGDKIQRAREALSRFIQTSHARDEYFLIGFNSRAQLLMDATRDSDAVLNRLTFVETSGNTALYDACYLGVEKLLRASHEKRAIILISDGEDNNSRYTFSEVRRLLRESDVLIYSVGILGRGATGATSISGQAILDELSSVSGGEAFFPETNAAMNDIFERIALELRHQYSIAYRPANFVADGSYHRTRVRVRPPRGLPRLYVRTRDGYYAVANPRQTRRGAAGAAAPRGQ